MPRSKATSRASTSSSCISSDDMRRTLERLKCTQIRNSTKHSYQSVWKKFNEFMVKLDNWPDSWEDRVSLFGAYLVEQGIQSSTLRSYVSAIKHTLQLDGYKWLDDKVLLSVLVRASRMVNDTLMVCLPIYLGLLELLLFELERLYDTQPYLCILYQGAFSLTYYGLMWSGEITQSPHVCKASDVHISVNKSKLLIILYTLKTHSTANVPQKIKITESESVGRAKCHFCPFRLLRKYIMLRESHRDENEQFLVFSDHSPVTPNAARLVLRKLFISLNLSHMVYRFHSFRSRRALDLLKFGVTIARIKYMGRWKSNAVFKYLKY